MTKSKRLRQAALLLLALIATSAQAATVVLPRNNSSAALRANPRNSWVYLMPTGSNYQFEQTGAAYTPITFKSSSINPLGLRVGTMFKGGWAVEASVLAFKFSLLSTYLGVQSESSHSGKNLSLDVYKTLTSFNMGQPVTIQGRLGLQSRTFFYAQGGLTPQFAAGTLTGANIGATASTNIGKRARATFGLRAMPTIKASADTSTLKGKVDIGADLGAIYLLSSAWVIGAQGSLMTAGASGSIVGTNNYVADGTVSYTTTSFTAMIGYQF